MGNTKKNKPFSSIRESKSYKIKEKFTWFEWGSLFILVVYAFGMLALLIWGFMNSFKSSGDFSGNFMGLPQELIITQIFDKVSAFGDQMLQALQQKDFLSIPTLAVQLLKQAWDVVFVKYSVIFTELPGFFTELYNMITVSIQEGMFLQDLQDGIFLDFIGNYVSKIIYVNNYIVVLVKFSVQAFQDGSYADVTFIGMLWNSILYAVIGALINTAVPCVMAYMTQRFNCWYSKLITAIVIVTMSIPIVGDAPAKIQLLDQLGLFNSMLGSWILKFSFLGMYYLVFLAAFEGVNKAYYEAAYVDGASEPRVMISVGFPMVRTVFFTVTLLRFIYYWNDYETTLIYLPDHPVLARGIYELSRSTVFQSVPEKLAGCMILLLPIMIIYFAFSKQLMSNISMGGVKE